MSYELSKSNDKPSARLNLDIVLTGLIIMLSVESEGAITIQRCSAENQKGAIAIDFVQR